MTGGFCFDAAIPDKQNNDLEIFGNTYTQNAFPKVQEFWKPFKSVISFVFLLIHISDLRKTV
jgi:hypothetical protein